MSRRRGAPAIRSVLPSHVPLRAKQGRIFRFPGLKTAVRQAATAISPLTETDVADICASFQTAIADTLNDRVSRSLNRFRNEFPDVRDPALVVAGGVAANEQVRTTLENLCRDKGFAFVAPPLELCTDNAAMIAWAGIERLRAGLIDDGAMELAPRSRWPLDNLSDPLIGAGRRGAEGMSGSAIAVLGGGAWGTALASTARRAGHECGFGHAMPETVDGDQRHARRTPLSAGH